MDKIIAFRSWMCFSIFPFLGPNTHTHTHKKNRKEKIRERDERKKKISLYACPLPLHLVLGKTKKNSRFLGYQYCTSCVPLIQYISTYGLVLHLQF
jgi:methionine aminopeptidase